MKSSTRPKSNNKNKMAKVDILFSFILVWSVVTTMLLVHQFQSNTALQQQLSETRRLFVEKKKKLEKKYDDRLREEESQRVSVSVQKREKVKKKYDDMTKEQDRRRVVKQERKREQDRRKEGGVRKGPLLTNQFPFTRSLERFRNSNGFFIYVVQSTESSSGEEGGNNSLEWSEVRWKDLVVNWDRNTTFDSLLQMSTRLENTLGDKRKSSNFMQKKFVLHCLPKAASTTLRRACYENMKKYCPAIDFPVQQDPFGYRNVADFFTAVEKCTDLDHFCVQGGDANMNVINYEGEDNSNEKDEDGEREPFHFIHMVPFRNFNDWVESAIKQIFVIDKTCDRIDALLDQCLGYRELYMELYPKSVLSLLTGMGLFANGKGISSKDKHHILLYNYKNVDSIVSQVSEFFDIEPMPGTNRRHKEQREDGTCPGTISEKFHQCHDKTLITADAIRNLETEKKRRKHEDRILKTMIVCMRNGGENCGENESRQ